MAVYPSIEIRGLEKLQATLDSFPGEVAKAKRRAVDVGGQQIIKFWKLHLSGPAGPRTLGIQSGALRNSIHSRPSSEGVIVGTDKPYAAIHEFGGRTKPHTISPRVGKFLRFRGTDGEWQFRRSVRHPGSHIPARPHRRPTVTSVWPILQLLFAGEFDKAMAESMRIGKVIGGEQWRTLEQLQAQGLTGRRPRG